MDIVLRGEEGLLLLLYLLTYGVVWQKEHRVVGRGLAAVVVKSYGVCLTARWVWTTPHFCSCYCVCCFVSSVVLF